MVEDQLDASCSGFYGGDYTDEAAKDNFDECVNAIIDYYTDKDLIREEEAATILDCLLFDPETGYETIADGADAAVEEGYIAEDASQLDFSFIENESTRSDVENAVMDCQDEHPSRSGFVACVSEFIKEDTDLSYDEETFIMDTVMGSEINVYGQDYE